MVKRKEDHKICLHCSKYVDLKKDHHVQLHTLNRAISPDDHAYFHFQCWVDYFNKRVENKMKANVQFMQEKAMSLFNSPVIKQALSQIQGSEIALNMVKMPLGKSVDPVLKQKIKRKLKNGKQKRSGKKRKAQVHKM
jgi:hypothetical protein